MRLPSSLLRPQFNSVVCDIFREQRVEFVGIIPRSDLLLEDNSYKRDLALVPTSRPIEDCVSQDDIVLLRRATANEDVARAPVVIDLLSDSSESSSEEEGQRGKKKSYDKREHAEKVGRSSHQCPHCGRTFGVNGLKYHLDHKVCLKGKETSKRPMPVPFAGSSDDDSSYHDEESKRRVALERKKTRDADSYRLRKELGAPVSKEDLPRPSFPGSNPIVQVEHGRRVYTCSDGETPKSIAAKFGLSPEMIVHHNRAHFYYNRGAYLASGSTLDVNSVLNARSLVLLPLEADRVNDAKGCFDIKKKEKKKRESYSVPCLAVGALPPYYVTNANHRAKKRLKERRKEVEMYGDRVPNDDIPRHINAGIRGVDRHEIRPGNFVDEQDRSDRRIYVCTEGETPVAIARKLFIPGPNPAGRVVFDNRSKHRGMTSKTELKEGDIIVLPPETNSGAAVNTSRKSVPVETEPAAQQHNTNVQWQPDQRGIPLRLPQEIHVPVVHVKDETVHVKDEADIH